MVATLKKTKNKGIITFKNVHNSIVNSIRRTILDDVPTFAIEDVEIISNDSPLYDETIAHRLGLIPIKTDLASYVFKDKCSCGGVGCAMCEVKMNINFTGPGYVYSSSIKSDDPVIIPADLRIPITKLFKEDDKFECNLKAILGTGRIHAKWAPAHVYFKEINGSTIDLIIEPYGQLDVKTIYNKSIDIIIEKIEELESKL